MYDAGTAEAMPKPDWARMYQRRAECSNGVSEEKERSECERRGDEIQPAATRCCAAAAARREMFESGQRAKLMREAYAMLEVRYGQGLSDLWSFAEVGPE